MKNRWWAVALLALVHVAARAEGSGLSVAPGLPELRRMEAVPPILVHWPLASGTRIVAFLWEGRLPTMLRERSRENG